MERLNQLKMDIKALNIAIVHDYLTKLGGAERVLKVISEMFPASPIYTLLYSEKKMGELFPAQKVHPSYLQKLPDFIKKRNRFLLPFLPNAIESFNLSKYDLVISSSGAFAHGVIVNSEAKHYCYCNSPMRFIWDYKNEYLKEQKIFGFKKLLVEKILKKIRLWDLAASDRVDHYIANSINVQKRIRKYYKKESTVIYPPVEIEKFTPKKNHEDYFLIVSRLSAYKKIDLAIKVFNKIKRKLIIIGEGSEENYLKSIAENNIEFLGFKKDETIKQYYENCRAFIFPGEDDFGITPIEAMACGKPVLAFNKGGAKETIISGASGEFFNESNEDSLYQGLSLLMLNEKNYDYQKIAKHAQNFSAEKFKIKLANLLKIN